MIKINMKPEFDEKNQLIMHLEMVREGQHATNAEEGIGSAVEYWSRIAMTIAERISEHAPVAPYLNTDHGTTLIVASHNESLYDINDDVIEAWFDDDDFDDTPRHGKAIDDFADQHTVAFGIKTLNSTEEIGGLVKPSFKLALSVHKYMTELAQNETALNNLAAILEPKTKKIA